MNNKPRKKKGVPPFLALPRNGKKRVFHPDPAHTGRKVMVKDCRPQMVVLLAVFSSNGIGAVLGP